MSKRISLMDQYSDEEFINAVLNSTSYKDCLLNLGYNSSSGSSINRLKNKINQLNIDTSHFISKIPIERTEENVFCENSTVVQKVLRDWYLKGKYSEYKCSICGQEPIWNGKKLTLILDHINGYNKDNRLENLRWICPNCNYQLDTTNGKNINHKNHKINHCVDCGKIIQKRATRCSSCAGKQKQINLVDVYGLTREQLKFLIRTESFVSIGKMYGVSDNAIRKWCLKYNLPTKSRDIKKYTDEDWKEV